MEFFIAILLCTLGLALFFMFVVAREAIQEVGFLEGLKEGAAFSIFAFPIIFVVLFLGVWFFTDDTKILIQNIKSKKATIDYIPPITFDVYRKFKIDRNAIDLCINKQYSPACFSLSNDYMIHDNRSRSEYYLEKIIDNEMDRCRLKGDISACENIARAYQKLDDLEKVKEYQKLINAIKEKNLERYF